MHEGKPTTRGECADGPRPCPYVSCRYHLYLDVSKTGRLTVRLPLLEPWELKETCALDVADKGGIQLEEVGALLGVTRQRIQEIEAKATRKPGVKEALRPFVEDERRKKRRGGRVRLPVLQDLEDLDEDLEDEQLVENANQGEEPLG